MKESEAKELKKGTPVLTIAGGYKGTVYRVSPKGDGVPETMVQIMWEMGLTWFQPHGLKLA